MSWFLSTVGAVADVSGGLTKNGARKTSELRRPYLTVANVYANRLELGDVRTIGVNASEVSRVELRAGDLLIVEGNGSLSQLGRVAVWNGAIAGCVHQNHLIKVRPTEIVCSEWLLYWLLSPRGRSAIERVGSSTSGLHTLSISKVAALPVVVAPLPEQKRIVEVIETQFTRLDAAVATLERVRLKLKAARASVLKSAVEGRLVPTEAELARAEGRSYEGGSVLLSRLLSTRKTWARGKMLTSTALPNMTVLRSAHLPEGWAWASFDQVGSILLGRQRAPQFLTGDHFRPYLRVANIKDDRIDLADVEQMDFDAVHFEKYRLEPGDILISEGQSPELVGQSAIFRHGPAGLCFQKTLHRFRPVPSGPSSEFVQIVLRAWVKNEVFKRMAPITTNIAHLTLARLLETPFPLPPQGEQTRIVAEVERRLSVIDEVEASVNLNLARCARLRQSMLKRAFEGKLVPQDPTHEPASALLAHTAEVRDAV